MAVADERLGIGICRYFTNEHLHPYDMVDWERRDVRVDSAYAADGVFERRGVEVPTPWSINATAVLAQQYLPETLGDTEDELSLRQVVDRVVDTITSWGVDDGYFVDDIEARTFGEELKYLLIFQRAAFNSLLWSYIALPGFAPEVAASFSPAVEGSVVFASNARFEDVEIVGNRATLNLRRFVDDDGTFDAEGFKAAIEVVFTAQEILMGNAGYPTEKIAATTRRFRRVGIGYANLGALLTALGLRYDSTEARAVTASVTALMTGHAYATSAHIAARMGPFAGYSENSESMLNVLRIHRQAVAKVDEELVPTELLSAAEESWDYAVELAEIYGVRNAQASVLASAGSASLWMDCTTTGIEPDKVADYSGRVKMIIAVQPFVGGSISTTVHAPRSAVLEDVVERDSDAWAIDLGLIDVPSERSAVDPFSNSPIRNNETSFFGPVDDLERELRARIADLEAVLMERAAAPAATSRTRLPRRRRSNTFAFRIADCEGYVTVGEYEDGRPGEVFIKASKQGSTLSGVMDAFAIAVSLGLQHGVPLSTFVRKYTNMRFEPAGITNDAELRVASSLVDYIFRRLALDYLSLDERIELGILSTGEHAQPTLPGLEDINIDSELRRDIERFGEGGDSLSGRDSFSKFAFDTPRCYACGDAMQRAGSLYACPSCGATSDR